MGQVAKKRKRIAMLFVMIGLGVATLLYGGMATPYSWLSEMISTDYRENVVTEFGDELEIRIVSLGMMGPYVRIYQIDYLFEIIRCRELVVEQFLIDENDLYEARMNGVMVEGNSAPGGNGSYKLFHKEFTIYDKD